MLYPLYQPYNINNNFINYIFINITTTQIYENNSTIILIITFFQET